MSLNHPFFCRTSFEGLFQVLSIPSLLSFYFLGCSHTAYWVCHPRHPITPLGFCIPGVGQSFAGLVSAALRIDVPFLERLLRLKGLIFVLNFLTDFVLVDSRKDCVRESVSVW